MLAAGGNGIVQVLLVFFTQLQPVVRVGPAEVRERQAREVEAPLGHKGKVAFRERWIASLLLHELLEQVEAAPARQVPGGDGWFFGSVQRGQGRGSGGDG